MLLHDSPISVESAPAGSGKTAVAEAVDATKIYGSGGITVRALDRVSIRFDPRTFTAVMGPSGSGKSTLMQALAGLETVDSGHILVQGRDLTAMTEDERTVLRRGRIGFVFQSYNLIPALNVMENITLPLELAGRRLDPEWFDHITGMLVLRDRLHHLPAELSGGQQQRVAVARALIMRPALILADEPTGNLDSIAGAQLLRFFRRAVDSLEQTVVMVTHDPVAASYADRVVFLADGRVVHEMSSPTVARILGRIKGLDKPEEV